MTDQPPRRAMRSVYEWLLSFANQWPEQKGMDAQIELARLAEIRIRETIAAEPAPGAGVDVRGSFEAEEREANGKWADAALRRSGDGYPVIATQMNWLAFQRGWNARAALAQAADRGDVEECWAIRNGDGKLCDTLCMTKEQAELHCLEVADTVVRLVVAPPANAEGV